MGRKPRLLSCCVQWPHRRHESLPSTQNSFIRNEGELLLLLKPLDASLSPAWPCVIVTLPKPSGPRFCALALAVRAKDRMRSRLRVFTVCLCASLFVLRPIALMCCLRLTNRQLYFPLIAPIVKSLGARIGSPLVRFDPLPAPLRRLHPEDHTRARTHTL